MGGHVYLDEYVCGFTAHNDYVREDGWMCHEKAEEVTCSTALVLSVLSMQDETKNHQQQQNQTAQCQHDEKPPLLIKRGVHLGCL